MIPRKEKLCKCGCGKKGFLWAKGMLKYCYYKQNPLKAINQVSAKTVVKIKWNNNYYRQSIAANIIANNGKCRCNNCPAEIKNPLQTKGSHVSHIISAGANLALYHNPKNHFILCYDCEQLFSNLGKRSTMKIYTEVLKRWEKLNAEYYNK